MSEEMDDGVVPSTTGPVEIETDKMQDLGTESGAVSMKAVSGEIAMIDLRQKMLTRLSNSEAHFKHQQRGEPDLTSAEKYNIAEAILNKNPVTFLSRFGRYLIEGDLKYFEDSKEEYEIKFYLTQISERLNSSKNQITVKNRRFEAMKRLVDKGEYFSDEEMKWRDPYLYDQMIGQYLTHDERQAEIDKSDLRFSTILLKHISQQQENYVYELQKEYEEGQEEEEEDSDSEEAAEEGAHADQNEDGEDTPTIPEDEKVLLREEFLHIMQERFISGQDKDFDYSGVDGNAEYDSLAIRAQDEEEKYFDGDDSDGMDTSGTS